MNELTAVKATPSLISEGKNNNPGSSVEVVKKPIEESFKKSIARGDIYSALLILENNNFPIEVIHDPETIERLKKSIQIKIADPYEGKVAINFIDEFKFQDQKKEILIEAIKISLGRKKEERGSYVVDIDCEHIKNLQEVGSISENELNQVVVSFVEQQFIDTTQYNWGTVISDLKKGSLITEEQVLKIASTAVKINLEKGNPDNAEHIIKNVIGQERMVEQKDFQEAGKLYFLKLLKENKYLSSYDFDKVQEKYQIPADFYHSEELKTVAHDRYLVELKKGNLKELETIKKFCLIEPGRFNKEELDQAQRRCLSSCLNGMFYNTSNKELYIYYKKAEYIKEIAETIGFGGDPFQIEELQMQSKRYIVELLKEASGSNLQNILKIKELYHIDPEYISEQVTNILTQKDDKGLVKFRTDAYNPLTMFDQLDALGVNYEHVANSPDIINAVDRYINHGWSGGVESSGNVFAVLDLYEKGVIGDDYIVTRKKTLSDICNYSFKGLIYSRFFEESLESLISVKEKLHISNISYGENDLITELTKRIEIGKLQWALERLNISEARKNTLITSGISSILRESSANTRNPELFHIRKLQETFSVPYEVTSSKFEEHIAIKENTLDSIVRMRKILSLPKDGFNRGLEGYITNVLEGQVSHAPNSVDEFDKQLETVKNKLLPAGDILEKQVREFIIKKLADLIIEYNYYGPTKNKLQDATTQEFIKKYSIREEDIKQAATSQVLSQASSRNMERVVEIIDMFSLSGIATDNPQVVRSFYRYALNNLEGEQENVIMVANKLGIVVDYSTAVEYLPRLAAFRDKLFDQFPHFPKTFPASIEELLVAKQLSEDAGFWETVKQYSFLSEALVSNIKYSRKLITYFHNFDELSKENITSLYEVKRSILEGNPEINTHSSEYRNLVQDYLSTYKNNSEIIQGMENQGVNIRSWLRFDLEEYFTLGKEQQVRFGDIIRTPIERINETVDKYTSVVKEGLKPYQPELQLAQVNIDDVNEIEKKIEGMKLELQKAKEENNSSKVAGIEKGIASWMEKKENPKKASVWIKLNNDIAALTQMANKISGLQNIILKTEEDAAKVEVLQMSPGEKRKEMVRFKDKINALQSDFKKEINTLEVRMEKFQTKLPEILYPVIGDARMESLNQEISLQTQEVMDHYRSDYSTLRNLFNEIAGASDKLEGRPMRLQLWSRNPDTDLYLGNYTNCCIRIDSTHMGAESTIADYLTDVGMQVVEVIDEKTDEPVVAAWVFPGVNSKGEAVLVVDNIEANTSYSNRFKDQLEEEIKMFIDQYAEVSNLKRVVQGSSNNDLVIAKMDGSYQKIGGYNRDDGYYLEGEDENTYEDDEYNDWDE